MVQLGIAASARAAADAVHDHAPSDGLTRAVQGWDRLSLNTDVPISEACKSEWTSMFAEDISRAKEVFQEVITAIVDLKKERAQVSDEQRPSDQKTICRRRCGALWR